MYLLVQKLMLYSWFKLCTHRVGIGDIYRESTHLSNTKHAKVEDRESRTCACFEENTW